MAKNKNTETKYDALITLYRNDEPVVFKGTDGWVKETGNSGAIIRDMLDGKVLYYKDWEYRA